MRKHRKVMPTGRDGSGEDTVIEEEELVA